MSRRTITLLGWIVIPIGIILACISSFWLTNFLFSSTFTFWKSLGSPPTGVTKIVYADRLNVWVETNNGKLFTVNIGCYKDEICKRWIEVKAISEIYMDSPGSIKRGDNCEELDIEELPRNPNGIMTDCVLAIYPGPEYDFKTYYAVIADGSIKYWRHESSYWDFFFFVISNIILSTLVVVIFFKIRKKVVANEGAG